MLEENPRDWHKILSEILWAYRICKRDSTGVSPYSQTYGQDVVFPMEMIVPFLRVSRQNGLNPQEYSEAMMIELEVLVGKRLQALDHITIQKRRWLGHITSELEERVLKESLFGRWSYPSVLKTENWGNGLLIGRDHSRFTKYCPKMLIDSQASKGSHTKGSSMGSTLRNTFPHCGKCWILSRKTKVGDEGVTRKIGLIDHFLLGKLFLVVTLSDKVGCFG